MGRETVRQSANQHRHIRTPSLTRAIALGLIVCAALLGAPAARAEKLTLMTGGVSKIIYLPVTLAARLGYFRDEGLDVEILSEPAGVDTATELIAGAIQGAVGFYDHTIDLQSRGMSVQSIVVLGRAAGLAELASTHVSHPMQSMTDVPGRKLGVTGFGSSTYFLSRYLAQRANVARSTYSVVALGPDNGFVDAMMNGSIDAGMVEEPTASRLLDSGAARVLVDMRTVEGTHEALGGPYASACVYVQHRWVAEHPDAARRLARALVRTLGYMASHPASEIVAQLSPGFVGHDKALYMKALNAALPSFSRDGRMPEGAPQTVLNVLSSVDQAIVPRHVDLARTYTNRFADEANTSLPH